MAALVFDIETVGEDFDKLDATTQEIVTRWIRKESENDAEYETKLEDLKNGLGFSPLTGEIVAIGVLDASKDKGVVYFQAPGKEIKETVEQGVTLKQATEKEMLLRFWEGAKQYQEFVSFNGRAFDIPFLMVRSAILGIRPSKNLLRGRYLYQQNADAKSIDLLDQLTFEGAVWKSKGNLHLWSRAFGIESPKAGGVTGDDVGALFRDERYLDIAKYNVGDLKATKALYEYWNTYLRF